MIEDLNPALMEIRRTRDISDDVLAQALARGLAAAAGYTPEDGEELRAEFVDGAPHLYDGEGNEIPLTFGRAQASAARRAIVREIERAEQVQLAADFEDQIGQVVYGTVHSVDNRRTLINLGRAMAVLPHRERIHGEGFRPGARIKAALTEVRLERDMLSLVVSRKAPEMVAGLMAEEVPEITEGMIEVVRVVRRPGMIAKVMVTSHEPGLSPIGPCIGTRGARIRGLRTELRGERIDLIAADDPIESQVQRAMGPVTIREIIVEEFPDAPARVQVVIPDEELEKAIGPKGANAQLAAEITGVQLEVIPASVRTEMGVRNVDETDSDHRCRAMLANGRRCPNIAVEGTRYCGLPAHAALINAPEPEASAPEPEVSTPEPEASAPEEGVDTQEPMSPAPDVEDASPADTNEPAAASDAAATATHEG